MGLEGIEGNHLIETEENLRVTVERSRGLKKTINSLGQIARRLALAVVGSNAPQVAATPVDECSKEIHEQPFHDSSTQSVGTPIDSLLVVFVILRPKSENAAEVWKFVPAGKELKTSAGVERCLPNFQHELVGIIGRTRITKAGHVFGFLNH